MKPIRLLALLSLVAIISSCILFKGAKSSDSIVLNFSVAEGQEFIITLSGTSETNTERMGQEISVTALSGSTMEGVSLGKTEDGQNKIQFKFIELTESMSSPMGDADTDFSAVLNKEMTINVAPKGDCSDFTGLEDMKPIATATGEEVDAQVFKLSIEHMFFELPSKPVKVGATWNMEVSNEKPYGDGLVTKSGIIDYTVTEIKIVDDLPCVIISSTGTIETSGKFQQEGMDLELKRTTKTLGKIVFAYTKGIFLSHESSSITTGGVDVPAMNMFIPQYIIGFSSIKLVFK